MSTAPRSIHSIAAALDEEPLARIMFGQRELFHSNLLAWFYEKLPVPADRVFDDLSPAADVGHPRAAEREQDHIDLVLWRPDRQPIALENKVFALPDMAQLDRYSAILDRWQGVEPSRVLLSASGGGGQVKESADGGLPVLPNGWRVLTYLELGNRIDTALAGENASYEVETMRRYAIVCRLIDALIGHTAITDGDDEPVWLRQQDLEPISSRQVKASLHKVRARRVAQYLEAVIDVGWFGGNLSHGQPLVEWAETTQRDGEDINVGWQYQEGQFRRFVVIPHLEARGLEAKARREEWARSHPDLFDFTALSAALGDSPQKHVMRGGKVYGHFDPDFIYQYVKKSDLTLGNLVAASRTLAAALDSTEDPISLPL